MVDVLRSLTVHVFSDVVECLSTRKAVLESVVCVSFSNLANGRLCFPCMRYQVLF